MARHMNFCLNPLKKSVLPLMCLICLLETRFYTNLHILFFDLAFIRKLNRAKN